MSELGLGLDQEPGGRRAERNRRRRRRRQRKRNGCACLVAILVLVGVLGGGGYYGYDFYQKHFGPSPDYSGKGSGTVSVKIPDGASTRDIAQVLWKAGVVKSTGAFVDEAKKESSRAGSIQPGTYQLHRRMSGAAAMRMLTDTKNLNSLTIPEGTRASTVYKRLDKKLKLSSGSSKKAAKHADLGLPDYAKGNPEGFLYPSRYSAAPGTKPEKVLQRMVAHAKEQYAKNNLVKEAKKQHRSPRDIIIIASLLEGEAQEDRDFPRVSRVIANRLKKPMALQFDSTINYALHRSTLDTTARDQKIKSPYNTYRYRGLPPGPISNPGHRAIQAALHPTKGPWLYFVSVRHGDTRFTASYQEHQKNVREFNEQRREDRKKNTK